MATACEGPKWIDHTQDGKSYSLLHLQPTLITYSIPAVPATKKKPGRQAASVKMYIVYSHHCFTNDVKKINKPDPSHIYTCLTRGEDRVFCPLRWGESRALPQIVKGLNVCYFTTHNNYFIYRPSTQPKIEYFIYFSVKPKNNYIELLIESAYVESNPEKAKRKKVGAKTSLNAIVINALKGTSPRKP